MGSGVMSVRVMSSVDGSVYSLIGHSLTLLLVQL